MDFFFKSYHILLFLILLVFFPIFHLFYLPIITSSGFIISILGKAFSELFFVNPYNAIVIYPFSFLPLVPFLVFNGIYLIYLYLLIKHKNKRFLIILLSITIVTIIPLFNYWYKYVRVPVPRGWKLYANNTGFKYAFSYPSSWFLTDCGNGEIVLSKTKVQTCEYPTDTSQEYMDNLYFQVFQPDNYRVEASPYPQRLDGEYPPLLKDWSSIFWSKQEFGYRRMWGDNGPLIVDPAKYPIEYPAADFNFNVDSKILRVVKRKYGTIEIGFNSSLMNENSDMELVIDTFRISDQSDDY